MKSKSDQARIKANFSQAKVLVIDDSDDHWLLIRKAMQACLSEVMAVRATTADQALDWLREWQTQEWELPKLIVQDLYVPERENGWALLRAIKEMPAPLNHIPILMLSSSTSSHDIMDAYKLGVSSYVTKPGSYEEWIAYFQELRAYWWETVSLPPLQFSL